MLVALINEYARKILCSTISSSKSIDQISRENDIPLSSCYRQVSKLLRANLVKVESIIISDGGKKYELFRSALKELTVRLDAAGLSVDVELNL